MVKILIIDDNFDDMLVMVTALEYHGFEVFSATNTSEFRDLLNQITPDLIITDLAMPETDGWGILEIIRRNPNTEGLVVVAVTAYHSVKLEMQVLEGGFDGYFPKPINPPELVEYLQTILGR